MSNNDETNYSLSSIYESFNRLADMASKVTRLISIDTGEITRAFENMGNRIRESLRPLYELYNSDMFENIGKTFKVFSDGILIVRLQSMGIFEWCNIDEKIDMSKYRKENEDKDYPLSAQVILHFRNKDYSAVDVDKYVGRFFTKEVIKNIENETTPFLDAKDAEKLKKAMIDYRARRYLDSANLLASLIDAQSIKQELYDIENNRYHNDNLDRQNNPNISQGWRAFYIVFRNNFSKYFDDEYFSGDSKKEKREKKFDEFLDNIKGKIPNDETIIAIVALSICLLNFFDDSDWSDYPEYRPSVINRHWLMHGMYDIEDITRYDCIKLLLMLNQISKIYSKLRNGEL